MEIQFNVTAGKIKTKQTTDNNTPQGYVHNDY